MKQFTRRFRVANSFCMSESHSNSSGSVSMFCFPSGISLGNVENATFRAASYALLYVDNFANNILAKDSVGPLLHQFAVPLTAFITRSLRFSYVSLNVPMRLFPRALDSHAMRKCTLEGGLHVVSTLLRARRFHLRRHSAAHGSNLKSAEDVVPRRYRCRRAASVGSSSRTSFLSFSTDLYRDGYCFATPQRREFPT